MDWVSWSAYHADTQKTAISLAAIIVLLPLCLDSAHTVAMIKHAMTIVQEAVQPVNPGQVSCHRPTTIYMPLPSKARGPHQLPSKKTFGGLHIKMSILKVRNKQTNKIL